MVCSEPGTVITRIRRTIIVNEEIRVTVWNEFRHEKENEAVKAVYPNGMHEVIAVSKHTPRHMAKPRLWTSLTAAGDEALSQNDALWWGHEPTTRYQTP